MRCSAHWHPYTRLALVRMSVAVDDAVPLPLQRSVQVRQRALAHNPALTGSDSHIA